MNRRNTCLPCLLVSLILLAGCQQADQNAELEKLRQQLLDAREQFEAAESSTASPKRQLVHLVWFKMKPDIEDAETTAFITELRKLDQIDQVNGLEIGKFQDLGDDRAMSELDLVMRMSFGSEADYRTYQDHAVHQQLKKDIGNYLGGPPVTYDYWTVE